MITKVKINNSSRIQILKSLQTKILNVKSTINFNQYFSTVVAISDWILPIESVVLRVILTMQSVKTNWFIVKIKSLIKISKRTTDWNKERL